MLSQMKMLGPKVCSGTRTSFDLIRIVALYQVENFKASIIREVCLCFFSRLKLCNCVTLDFPWNNFIA